MEKQKKEFLEKYKELESLNPEIAEYDFGYMVEELKSPNHIWLRYFEIKELETLIDEMSGVVDLEYSKQLIPDFVERPRLCRNEY